MPKNRSRRASVDEISRQSFCRTMGRTPNTASIFPAGPAAAQKALHRHARGPCRRARPALQWPPARATGKGEEHVGPHEQIQLILRIAFPKLAQRIHGIARAGPVKLDAADLHAGFSSYGKLREREARFAVRRAFGHGLVRRDGCGDQENFVQSQQLPRLARGKNMPQMRRIEAAAVNADPCHAAPLPCRCSFYCSSFCWRLRSMAAETALSWKYCLRCFRCCSAACLRARSPALTGL